MRSFAYLALAVLACLFSSEAKADKRVALVLGNSKYQNVPNLPNPANDARAMKLLFERAGFDVVRMQEDVGVAGMRRAVRDFTEATRDADIGVIYYAGHGIELNGMNYLVPIDASLRRDIDVEDETVSLERLLQVLEPAKRLRLVILDACRDNPFTKSMARTMVSRSIGRGLARVEPVTSDTLIAFAAKAGSTASDGAGAHSPFTGALLKHIVTPGLDVRLAFGRVRDEVLAETNSKQEPFVYGSLGGKAVTLAALSQDDRPGPPPAADPDAPSARDYEATAKVATKEAWQAFLQQHPTGLYADLARAQLTKLEIEKAKPQPPSPSSGTASQPKAGKEPKSRSKESESTGGPIYQRCMAQYKPSANGDLTFFWKQARTVCRSVARNPSPSCLAGGRC